MTSSQVLSIYIKKLNHPIREIRVRSLKLLTAKLGLGWELEDELSCTRELIEAMLNWFHNPQPSLQTEALELLLRTIKTKAGTYIAKELGVKRLIANLDQLKHKLTDPSSLEVYEDIVETLRFLNTVESEDNVAIPRLNLPSTASSDSDQINGYYNIDTNIQFSNETSISSEEIEIRNVPLSKISDSIKIVLLPWVELNSSDSKTMLLIEDALKLLKSVRRCCRFIGDVFLRDFPAEIFLNRPAIIKNLLAIASGNHGNRPGEALQVLLNITRALRKRLLELCCVDLIHDRNKLPDDPTEAVDQTNIELEQMTECVDLDLSREDGLAALRQLPAPIYSLDALHTILSTVARSLVAVDSTKSELLNLKELNICVDLTDSLIDLLFDCVSEDFWSVAHSTKTHRDVAHKSCVLMRLLGDVLNKLQQSYSEDSEKCHHRAVWLRLVSCAERLMHWARSSALPPAALVAALQRASLDPALQLLHPRCSERVTLVLQSAKTSVDHEYKMKYRELSKLTSAMDDAVLFMKNKNSCRNSKNVFRIIQKSLPVLELHMSETFLNDVADILLRKTKDFDMDDSDWEVARRIALNLMTHNVEWIRAKFYSLVVEMVRIVLVGDEENQAENEKCLTLLCDVSLLTEICCHGLSSKTKPVEASANEIILYLLRGRMVLSESCWWRLLASLLPVLPLLHVYAEHDTLLGKAICKSLTHDIASCMGVSLSEVVGGLTRLLFVRCVAVQLDAAHSLCQLLDDERYLPPKEALRADILLNALKRVQPQEFNIDHNSSPSKTPQTTGLLQLLDVLKQDIMLDEHGTEYVSSTRFVQPTLEPVLRRSTLQQLAAMLRQQELHAALLQSDGLRVCVATLRMSLMVDDYLAYPECAISCVSILNSVCFASRHSLAKIPDLPSLLIRVILVFPANDSAVCMAAQVLALLAWSGFALQELDSNRRRVPALPACVVQRTVLPFSVNAYWTSSPNAEHSSIEWMSLDEHWVRLVRVRWWCAYCGRQRVLCGAPLPPAPLTLQPTERDRALLRDSCPVHSSATALLALENATSHSQVSDALCLLESYAHLLPPATPSCEEYSALPWQHMRRFLCAPPASSRDTQLLTALMGFILTYIDAVAGRGGTTSWIKDTFIGTDTAIISLLSRDQLLPQQTAQESIEVTQLHISIVKVLLRCVKQLEYEDYDSSKLESLLKILLACLVRIDLKNFHALGYLNELLRCIRYVLHSRYCQLSEDTLVHSFKVIASTLSGCAAGGGRKGHSCRLDAILTLLALLHQAQRERIPVQRWCEVWNTTAVDAVAQCVSAATPTLRAAALKTIAALAHYAQLQPHLQQAIREESLSRCGAQILAERGEAAAVRAGAADLVTAVTARVSAHSDVLECDVLAQFKVNNIVDVCIEILVDFCNGKKYERTFEANVPLSVLERRSELEVRAQKCGDVRVRPSLAGRGRAPPTAPLAAAVADMLHNVGAFARAPVQAWNEKGLYRLLFRCASLSIGTKADTEGVPGAACRALVAAASHKCVRSTLAATKDCLHNLLLTLKPLQEDEMDSSCIYARAQALLLLARVLAERAAADSVWGDLADRQPTTFFSCLLQSLDTDEIDLQAAALLCLTQLSQSIVHKKQSDKAPDPSRVQLFDSLKSPYTPSQSNDRLSMGDSARGDCQPEYMAEEMCRVLIEMYRKISLDNMKYQCSEDDFWTRVCACLSSVLTASGRARTFAVHRGLPKILLGSLQAVRDHLSVLGKPVETLKNANHNPTLRILYWLLTVMNSSMVECPAAKEGFAEDGIAVSLNRLWPWCMMTDQLRLAVLGLLFNFTNDCPKAWSSMSTCVGSRNLTLEVCSLAGREAALQSRARPAALLLLCAHTARHTAHHHQCRAQLIKNDVISIMYKSILRDRHGVSSIGDAWARLCCALSRYPEGGAALLALRPRLPALPAALRPRLLPALAHAAHHQRESVLHDPDLLELLSGSLLAGDTHEVVAAAHAVWALAANNHKAKLVLRSAGVAASVQAGAARLQRARDPAAPRARQLLAYTRAVLHAP